MIRVSRTSYSLLSVILATQLFFALLRFSLTGVTYYRVVRVQSIVNVEFLMLCGSLYIWKRLGCALSSLEPSTITPTRLRWRSICIQDVSRAILILFLVLTHVSFVFYFIFLGTEPNILAVCSLTSLAAYLHLFIFLLIADFVFGSSIFCSKLGYFPTYSRYVQSNRNTHIFLATVCALIFVMSGLYSTFREPVYTRVTVPMRKLNSEAGDLKVALLSDIHLGPTVGHARMKDIARLTNDLNPDIIAISGDLADGFLRELKHAAEPLCSLSATKGVYFATGNHEYMHGNVEEWFEFLRKCNITVLHNSNKRVSFGTTNLCIAGTDDLYAVRSRLPGHIMDPKKALDSCQMDDLTIVLAHQPNAAKSILSDSSVNKKVDLVLSGHTHGGQMYMFIPIVYLFNAFTRGLYQHSATGAYVYVSAGVNFFGPPIKIFGACEIIDITLTPL